jgi:hypothetical protein
MNDRFEPGEVAIIQNCDNRRRNGRECTVVKGLDKYSHAATYSAPREGPTLGYIVELDGEMYFAEPHHLRKKKPPAIFDAWEFLEEITDGWNPTKVKA